MASQNTKTSSKKPKLVRDSFTIPKAEFAAIDLLKNRAIALGTSVKKSELLRAGLMLLTGLNDAALKSALAAVPTLKTGRPAAPLQDKPSAKPAAASPTAAKPAKKKPAPAKAVVKKAVSAPKPVAKPAATPVAKAAATPVAKAAATPVAKAAAKPVAKAGAKPAARTQPAAKSVAGSEVASPQA